MKETIDLPYFVFGALLIIGVLRLFYDCFRLMVKAKNEKPPHEMILKLMDIASDITLMSVGLLGGIMTLVYKIIFL